LAQWPPFQLIDFSTGSQVRLSSTNTPGNIVLQETDNLALLNGQFSVIVDVTESAAFSGCTRCKRDKSVDLKE
jgi:hypothetical protein